MEVETEQSNPAPPVALATPAATEPVATVEEAATEIIQLAATTKFPGKTREEIAAIEIQTSFRAYMVCGFSPLSYPSSTQCVTNKQYTMKFSV